MKIIISPAKKMREDADDFRTLTKPCLLEKTKRLQSYLKQLSCEELKQLFRCSDEIARSSQSRFKEMDFQKAGHAALLSYDGIQYRYMAPQIFEEAYFDYVSKHLRILSGFYGILKPFDEVYPYRLEMQTKLKTDFCRNLYDFWKDDLYQALDDHVILNLASKEYSQAIKKYLLPGDVWTECLFAECVDGKIKEKGVYVKMARGEMTAFMAQNQIENLDEIRSFDRLGFKYQASLSNPHLFVFLREGKRKC